MIFSGESEQLIEQAKGKLWMCYLDNEEKPFEDAKIAEVSLEDGYIYVNMKK